MKLHTAVVLLPWTCCFFIIRIRTIWNDWATGLWEGVLKNTGMLLYPLLQSRCSKKSSSIACIQGLSKPCGILGTWGSGTDLSAMSVANSCGLFSFLGGQEAQSLPSQRAQGNSWLLDYPNKEEQLGLGTHLHDALENVQRRFPLQCVMDTAEQLIVDCWHWKNKRIHQGM